MIKENYKGLKIYIKEKKIKKYYFVNKEEINYKENKILKVEKYF